MTRLSLIVPYSLNDAQIERTLLSLLENRPSGVEILLPHDGRYADPYRLGGDEIVLIECDRGTSVVGLINQAIHASCSPVLQILLPGTTLRQVDFDAVIEHFDDQTLAAASPVMHVGPNICFGIDPHHLPKKTIHHLPDSLQSIPMLDGGCYRRRTLLSLGGFFDRGSVEVAELDFCLAARTLGLRSDLIPDCEIDAPVEGHGKRPHPYTVGHLMGELTVAYSRLDSSDIETESIITSVGRIAGGLMHPSAIAQRLGWTLGLRDRSLEAQIRHRIEKAIGNMHPLNRSQTDHKLPNYRMAA